MTDVSSVYAKARSEVASMLGYTDLDNLSPEASTRLDIGTSLRVLLDHQSGRLLRGESLDARELLLASDALAKILPPLREPPPAANAPDPRTIMWETYLGMRRRGEAADLASTFEGRGRRIAELEAEIERLKAGTTVPVEDTSSPLPDNVVPLARPTTTDRSVVSPSPPPAAASAAPEEEYEDVVVTEAVLGQPEPWRPFVGGPDNSIISTPGRKWWGPVGS
jgi:hypothetical protein